MAVKHLYLLVLPWYHIFGSRSDVSCARKASRTDEHNTDSHVGTVLPASGKHPAAVKEVSRTRHQDRHVLDYEGSTDLIDRLWSRWLWLVMADWLLVGGSEMMTSGRSRRWLVLLFCIRFNSFQYRNISRIRQNNNILNKVSVSSSKLLAPFL